MNTIIISPSPSPAELRRQARALLRQAHRLELVDRRAQVVEWQRAFDEWHAQNPTRSMQEWPAWEAYLDLEAQAEL